MPGILIVTTSFPLKPGDGLSPFVWEYCRHIRDKGWRVRVLAPHHRGLKKSEEWDGINISRFQYLPERFEDMAYSGGLIPGLKKKPWKIFKMPFYIYSAYSSALRIASRENIEIVNFHWLFPAGFWVSRFVKKTGMPVVFTGHGTDIHLAMKFPFSFFARRALKRSAAVTVNSVYIKSLLDKDHLPEKVEIIPMGVDTSLFFPGQDKPSAYNKVIFVGRLIRQKGINLLIDAFAALRKEFPDAILEIIGYGPEKEYIRTFIRERNLGGCVILTPPVNHAELAEKYRNSRLLAMPSLVPEGFGMTAAEAAACGRPTITFGLGGTSELVIHDRTGIVTEQNASALADGFKRLFENGDLADELGAAARRRIEENFSWGIISGRFDSLFKSITSKI